MFSFLGIKVLSQGWITDYDVVLEGGGVTMLLLKRL